MRKDLLQLAHDNTASGHLGREKTVERLRRNFHWQSPSADVQRYVKACAACNRSKYLNRRPKAPRQSFTTGFPMEKVHMDIQGPLPESQNGNKYVLLMVDQFAKWVVAAAIPDQTAETVARAATDFLFSRIGCPREICTDQGTNFGSQLFTQLCEMLEIAKKRTTPYHTSANGQVDRVHRTLLQMIRCTLKEGLTYWDSRLQMLMAAVRFSVNNSTGFTPNQLMLGREVTQPLLLMAGVREERTSVHAFVEKIHGEMQRIHELTREALQEQRRRQKRDYDIQARAAKYAVGGRGPADEFSHKGGTEQEVSTVVEGTLHHNAADIPSAVSNCVI